MVAFVYFIPFFTCLILKTVLDYNGKFWDYFWILLFGEVFAALLHWLFYKHEVSATEYLGSFVTEITHEDEWIEIIHYTETKTDNNGRTYTISKTRFITHPEKYYFKTSIGSTIKTDKDFCRYVINVWQTHYHGLKWTSSNIKGGVRFGKRYKYIDVQFEESPNHEKLIPITEKHTYKNKIRNSNSIFKFETVNHQSVIRLGLYDYPKINQYDMECILSNNFWVDNDIRLLYRKLNAVLGSKFQVRVFILLFNAESGIISAEYQRALWQGGNKNEFIICIGLDEKSQIEWARCFSWADSQDIEVKTAQWLMDAGTLDWQQLYNWLNQVLYSWKRKEFSDFNYIWTQLPLWKIITIFALSIIENSIAIYVIL